MCKQRNDTMKNTNNQEIISELKTLNEVVKSCYACQNGSCRVENDEKRGLDEKGNPVGHDCVGYINHNLNFQKTKKLK